MRRLLSAQDRGDSRQLFISGFNRVKIHSADQAAWMACLCNRFLGMICLLAAVSTWAWTGGSGRDANY